LQPGLCPACTVCIEVCRIGRELHGGATAASIACSWPVDQFPPTLPQPTSPQVTSQVGSQPVSHGAPHDDSQQLVPHPKNFFKKPPRDRHIRSQGKLMPLPQPLQPVQLPQESQGLPHGGSSA
jgi:hypothetical protein